MAHFRFLFGIYLSLLLSPVFGQITTAPTQPVASQNVIVTFDSSQDSRLGSFTGDLYAHTGVVVEGVTDWQHVIGSWGDNSSQPKLTNKGNGIYELEITPDINTYYSVPSNEKVVKLAFVFRSSDGSTQTNDLFVDIYPEGLWLVVSTPSDHSILKQNMETTISASASVEGELSLWFNDTQLAQTTGKEITTNTTFTSGGNHWIIAKIITNSETKYDSVPVYIKNDVTTQTKPIQYKKGINYTSGQSAALVLWAPEKEFVYVLGDFNNWQLSEDYQMKKDGDYFWLDIPNLEKGKEYAFQYLIDGNLKIADPYTEKILDPWNDSYINETTYPNLKTYPSGKTEGIISVLQPGQEEYQWTVNNFTSPEKEKTVIYEMLIRDFTEQHTYDAVIEKLDYLEDLRINVLELMPVNEFEGNSSWGYNPSFYFAPDKYYGPKNELKRLIDECHKRGIAVVIDMVLNHSYGQSPFVQMYWDASNNRPAANNPWYNQQSNFQNPDAQWGYDFNHESVYTRELVDSINSFWMNEYKVDGFRFDFTKGFSNTVYGPSDWGSAYDAARIANLKRMANEIWKRKPDAFVIFEHLADNYEEKELAAYDILLWGNMNYNYNEASMGFNQNGQSDLKGAIYSERDWSKPNLVTYMESHDEERLMYKNLQYGNSEGSYSIKELGTALDRMELNSVFFIPLPGPKMIWQFGELGYDYSIDSNGGRLSEKPVRWDYLDEKNRTDLFQVMAKLNELKQQYDVFSPDNTSYSLAGATKWYKLSKGNNHVVGLGNFDVTDNNIAVTFPSTGKYYEFFSGDSIEISNTNQTFTFTAGEYRLYSTQQFEEPSIVTDIDEIENTTNGLKVYPNPVSSKMTIASDKTISSVQVYSIAGTLQYQANELRKNKVEIDVQNFTPGVYLVRVIQNGNSTTQKVLVK